MNIKLQTKPASERRKSQLKPTEPLPFGKLRTDHMFVVDYIDGEWTNAKIVPYSHFEVAPGAVVIHYAQSIFEGAKAFMHDDSEIYTFRINKNAERMNVSADCLCMPSIPVDFQIRAIHTLIDIDRYWFPVQEGASLYIRPFMFGVDDSLGVHPSSTYKYAVILSPSGPYYTDGFSKPIRLLITKRFHRAAPGGTGYAKVSGNYAASLKAGEFAKKFNAAQVLYLDSTNTYIEEAGSMNHYHITKDGTVVLPEFTNTILKSITSLSIIEMAEDLGLKVVQKKIKIDDFIEGVKSGEIVEAGGFGTAAVISAVGEYVFEDGSKLVVGDGKIGKITRKIYDYYTAIQYGKIKDKRNWLFKVERMHT